jgi:hypothetical protein
MIEQQGLESHELVALQLLAHNIHHNQCHASLEELCAIASPVLAPDIRKLAKKKNIAPCSIGSDMVDT